MNKIMLKMTKNSASDHNMTEKIKMYAVKY